jgi:hypothetical protein
MNGSAISQKMKKGNMPDFERHYHDRELWELPRFARSWPWDLMFLALLAVVVIVIGYVLLAI